MGQMGPEASETTIVLWPIGLKFGVSILLMHFKEPGCSTHSIKYNKNNWSIGLSEKC